MDNKTVLSDNELIAEFMGEEIALDKFGANWKEILKMQGVKDGAPPYDTSWDWLMPVVEKIQFFAHLKIENGQCFISVNGVLISGVVNGSNIENTYKAVVEYIKYYNSTKTL